MLRGHGLRAEHYHAGLEGGERTRVQDAFLAGGTQTVVATTAFGMGIDKPDVRLVCLVNYPGSLEEYVQMVGRAGRDGEPSDTLLLAGPADAQSLRRFALADVPEVEELRAVYRVLRDARGLVDPEELAAVVLNATRASSSACSSRRVSSSAGSTQVAACVELLATLAAAARVEQLLERARLVAESRADRVVAFAETRACRHAQVAEHFGEPFSQPCAMCDVCAPQASAPRGRRGSPPLPDDVGAAIVEAVASLRWPLGRQSLVATLRGSLKAPPSARRSLHTGCSRRRAKRTSAAGFSAPSARSARREDDAGGLSRARRRPGCPSPDGSRQAGPMRMRPSSSG